MSSGYRLVDTITCVKCGQKWFEVSKGKSSRSFNAICEGGCNAPSKNESVHEPESVSKRDARKAS